MIYSILASILLVTALVLFFDLTPERVTDDILSIITPKDSMRERAKSLRGNRKKHKLYRALMKFKTALETTGRSKTFTVVCFASIFLFGAGIIFSIMIGKLLCVSEDCILAKCKQQEHTQNSRYRYISVQAKTGVLHTPSNHSAQEEYGY